MVTGTISKLIIRPTRSVTLQLRILVCCYHWWLRLDFIHLDVTWVSYVVDVFSLDNRAQYVLGELGPPEFEFGRLKRRVRRIDFQVKNSRDLLIEVSVFEPVQRGSIKSDESHLLWWQITLNSRRNERWKHSSYHLHARQYRFEARRTAEHRFCAVLRHVLRLLWLYRIRTLGRFVINNDMT